MKPYRIHRAARREIGAAANYYREKQPGLERRFLDALEDAIRRVRTNPSIHRKVEDDIRKCRLPRFPRFPFGLLFRERLDRIEILAVMHLRRDPGYWKNRR
ncbi:type II toxin-antitoxin system RelE/ParE family toxin [Endothiovibrio diazotrophicus]